MASRFEPAIDAVDQAIRHSTHFREWLRSRRWCGDSIGMRAEVAVKDRAVLVETGTEALVLFLAVVKEPERQTPIHLPLALSAARTEGAVEVAAGPERVFVSEAERREAYARFLADGFERQERLPTMAGDSLHFLGEKLGGFRSMAPPVGDSSNLLARFATARFDVLFKSYKLLDVHNREPDILERLGRKQFPHAPRFLGELSLGTGPDRLVLGVATQHVDAPDLFAWLADGWRAELGAGADRTPGDFERDGLDVAGAVGEATAALHEALVDRHPGPWQAEVFRPEDATAARRGAITNLGEALRRLAVLAKGPEKGAADAAARARRFLFDNRGAIEETLRGLDANVGTAKCVTHGDLPLAQVLRRASDGALLFVDFEGEPERSPGQRSVKLPPLRDVATMGRSFVYMKHYAWRDFVRGDATAATRMLERDGLSGPELAVVRRLSAWEDAAVERLSTRYLARSSLYREIAPEEAVRAIRGWMMEKALYEFRYELKFRPENIFIPLEGIVSLAGTGPGVG
ncbi:MAG: hypothetical protein A3K65_03855 [Euryarchaeota archaeon RBG_16_68_12]|nr:MAG: hypothetical protein A3K65_03855 [Euryarchaeota archaeon RBG_16_68_12]